MNKSEHVSAAALLQPCPRRTGTRRRRAGYRCAETTSVIRPNPFSASQARAAGAEGPEPQPSRADAGSLLLTLPLSRALANAGRIRSAHLQRTEALRGRGGEESHQRRWRAEFFLQQEALQRTAAAAASACSQRSGTARSLTAARPPAAPPTAHYDYANFCQTIEDAVRAEELYRRAHSPTQH